MASRFRIVLADGAAAALARIAERQPRLAVMLSDALAGVGRRAGLLGRDVRPLARIYAQWSGGNAAEIERGLVRDRLKSNLTLALRASRDDTALARLIEPDSIDALREAVSRREGSIVALWHMGPALAVVYAAIAKTGVPAVTVDARKREAPAATIESIAVEGPAGTATLAFARAVRSLREGRVVLFSVDGEQGSDAPPITCLGRDVCFRRGIPALARLTGAPVIPVGTAWTKSGPHLLALRIGAPIEAEGANTFEKEMSVATGLARWLERHLVSVPTRISESFTLATQLSGESQHPGGPGESSSEARE